MSSVFRLLAATALALVVLAPVGSRAVTVTFDSGSGLFASYTEAGITVAPALAFHVVDVADHDGNLSGDLLNRPVCCTTPYDFTYTSGVFSVAKFDFVLNAGPHVFTSSLGSAVSPGASGTVTLPVVGWTGITSFRWDANGANSSTDTALMDNLKFCPGNCDDGNGCTNDACDPDNVGADANGCTHTANSAPCTDNLFCNGADTCGGGTCSIHAGDPCAAGGECANLCTEATDSCLRPAATPCTDDGNICTNDACDGAGACAHPNNSAPCTDNVFCNGADTCSGGSCIVHAGNPCTGGPECNNICNEGPDNCFRPANAPCTDEGNVCTNDICDGAGACTHPNNTASCTDNSVCTTTDQCSGGICVPGPDLDCDDGLQCTLDTCDDINGCQHNSTALNGTSCDDGDTCTDNDTCSSGVCSGTQLPQNCDDGNPCTLDSCNPQGGCLNDPAGRDGFVCDDTNTCTNQDVCANGICRGTLAEADTDLDGFCDRVENDAGCNPNDAAEIPPQSNAFSGRPGRGLGEVLLTYNAPNTFYMQRLTEPSCGPGVCGAIGFCTGGKIADPCAIAADCDPAPNGCRIVVNAGEVPDLTLISGTLNRLPVAGFSPLTPGCSRKVDLTLDPARRVNNVRLKATGTITGLRRRDVDRFKYR
jgi:Dictyostelium (slime mold) repeat